MEISSENTINSVLPNEMLSHVFTFLSPPDLAISSLVCNFWKEIAERELTNYKFNELDLRLSFISKLVLSTLVPTKEELSLIKEFEPLFSTSGPLQISSEDFLFYRKSKTKMATHHFSDRIAINISGIFLNFVKMMSSSSQEETHLPTKKDMNIGFKIKECIDHYKSRFVEVSPFYVLDLNFEKDQYERYALKNLETPEWLGYIDCDNFHERFDAYGLKAHYIGMSRNAAQSDKGFAFLKKVRDEPKQFRPHFNFFSSSLDPVSDSHFVKNLFDILANMRIGNLSFTKLQLNDEDAYYISLLIKRNNPSNNSVFRLSACYLHLESLITTTGLKLIYDALSEMTLSSIPFKFYLLAFRNDLNSEGLDLMKTLEGKIDESWQIDIKIVEKENGITEV